MGRRGPAPTPTSKLKLKGTLRKHRSRKEPKPDPTIQECPDFLDDLAKQVWQEIVLQLAEMNVLTRIDANALARYCGYFSRWRMAEAFIEKHGEVYPIKTDDGSVKHIQQVPQVAISHKLGTLLTRLEQEFGMTPSARSRIQVNKDNLSIESTYGKCVPLGGDADSTDGLSPSCCVIDELHAHRSRDHYDVLDTATGSRRQSLFWCITTAGHYRNSICWDQHDYGTKLLEETVEDDSHFAFIAAIDEGDDWADESEWPKANPNLNVSLKIDDLRRKAKRAAEMPHGAERLPSVAPGRLD